MDRRRQRADVPVLLAAEPSARSSASAEGRMPAGVSPPSRAPAGRRPPSPRRGRPVARGSAGRASGTRAHGPRTRGARAPRRRPRDHPVAEINRGGRGERRLVEHPPDATQWTSSVRPAAPRTLRRERGVGAAAGKGGEHEPSAHLGSRSSSSAAASALAGTGAFGSHREHAGGRDPDHRHARKPREDPTDDVFWMDGNGGGAPGPDRLLVHDARSGLRRVYAVGASSPRRARRSSMAASTRTATGRCGGLGADGHPAHAGSRPRSRSIR